MSGVTTRLRGFTLIELLVVISIIGLLSSIVLAALSTTKTKAQNARIQSDIHQWHLALELYYAKFGYYPLPSTGNRSWACLGKYSDNACWTNGTGQSEDTVPLTGLDAQLSLVIAGLPPGQVVQGSSNTYEGAIYQCRTLNSAGKCTEYWIYWIVSGKNATCSEEGRVVNGNLQSNSVTECQLDVTS
ncbi:MAG TPA: type II secretion system protein [Candidatus Paceibacterota bacterium]|nr:type II secretion system protein [Candidatus Paceibacterota bacterium]